MAKKTPSAATVYAYASEVADIGKKDVSLKLHGKYTTKEDYLDRWVTELRARAKAAEVREEKFFNTLQLRGSNGPANLKILQERIDTIRASDLDNLDIYAEEIYQKLQGITGGGIDSDALIEPISNLINQNRGIILEDNKYEFMESIDVSTLLSQLVKVSNTQKGTQLSDFRINTKIDKEDSSKNRKTKLNSQIVVTYTTNGFKVEKANVDSSGEIHIGQYTKQSILKLLKAYGQDTSNIEGDTNTFKNKLKTIILSYVTNPKAKEAIIKQFNMINRYDVYNNKNSLKGFLGELSFNAIMSLLLDNAAITPTGNLKRTGQFFKGKSVTIDSVINGYGFQIKNYSLNSKTVTFDGINKEAGSLFGNRMEIQDLVDLMSAYQYNQPLEQDPGREKALASYRGLYGQIAKYIKDDLVIALETHTDKLIGLSNENYSSNGEFSELRNIIGNANEGINSFFYISGTLVPASSIYTSMADMLDQIKGKDKSRLISGAEVSVSEPEGSPRYSSAEDALSSGVSRFSVANKIKVNWHIKMDLGQLLTKAINLSKKT